MGAQLLLTSFATRLHGNCNGSNNGMEDGGREHTCHSLGLGISAPTPNFRILFGTGRGNSSVFSSQTRQQEILKSHHLQARVTLAALYVPTPTKMGNFNLGPVYVTTSFLLIVPTQPIVTSLWNIGQPS